MKTYSAKPKDITRKWYLIDASTVPVGRLATNIAQLLLGKHKPQFTSHVDCGDYVVVTNTDKLVVTGRKFNQKVYYKHSGFPGGLKERTLAEQVEKDSTQVIVRAVHGMLPANKLRDERLKRLKVYAGADHNHEAQKPELISFKESK